MHLNGIGTDRNCRTAVELLKRVCERGTWVSRQLQEAYDHEGPRPESAAWIFLKLAEAGHEVAQMNLAHLLDSGSPLLIYNGTSGTPIARDLARIYAQRHFELSAGQGNVFSHLRLGDYAYYGWGLRVDDGLPSAGLDEAVIDDDAIDDETLMRLLEGGDAEVRYVRQDRDVGSSVARYRRTATARITGEWMQPYVARASFNLGLMHQLGLDVAQDIPLARQHYARSLEADPDGVQSPVLLMLALMASQVFWAALPPPVHLARSLIEDMRTHALVVQVIVLLVLVLLRRRLATTGIVIAAAPDGAVREA